MSKDNCKGYVRIPNAIKCDNRLTAMARLLYGDILSLSSSSGCYAGNKYFSNTYSCSIKTISRAIKQLEEYGYIQIENNNNSKRYIIPLLNTETKMSKYKDKGVSHNKNNKKGFINVDGEQIYV
tara:strand:+ start:4037 stop:4408 length:372 start_codon:yes stop_codon:yes gene_type:complete